MSVFTSNFRHQSFLWQINAVCFVLGLILAGAINTVSQLNRAGVGNNRVGFSYGSGLQVAAEKAAQYESEIKKLRARNTELENKVSKGTDAASTINKDLQDTKFLAGLTETEGPGVQITLMDSQRHPLIPTDQGNLIHDVDIITIVNELRASGAEAIAISGQRVVASTAIRCAGPTVLINGVPKAPPCIIQAIGDPETLFAGMNLPGGVLDGFRRFDPAMVKIEKKKQLKLPAFAGGTTTHYAKPPTAAPGSKEEK